MADVRIALRELLRKYRDDTEVDALKEGLVLLVQELMEAEVKEKTGAERYERTKSRRTYRNGYRPRRWDTRVGSLTLRIPKVRQGSYFPALLEPRRRTEKALLSVVQEAYVHGVSTRKVDDLVRALGIEGISRSEVSRICAALDERMEAFRNRPLGGEYPYVWLDATVVKVREGGRVVNMAAVVAVGVTQTGEREVLGFDVGAAESYGFWVSFLRGLASRGLSGVKLVISDAHVGLRQALSEVLAGASWQRCRVHFMRNLLGLVPRGAQPLVGAWVRTIFAQPDQEAAREQLELVVGSLEGKYPKAADLLRDAGEDVITHMAFPQAHWRRIHSTNVLERLHREIKRRCNVVGIFPNARSALRLIGAVLEEQGDEWLAVRRYFSLGSMAALYGSSPQEPEVLALEVPKEVIAV